MKKKILVLALALFLLGGTIVANAADMCGCGCGHTAIEGTTHCGCGWAPDKAAD